MPCVGGEWRCVRSQASWCTHEATSTLTTERRRFPRPKEIINCFIHHDTASPLSSFPQPLVALFAQSVSATLSCPKDLLPSLLAQALQTSSLHNRLSPHKASSLPSHPTLRFNNAWSRTHTLLPRPPRAQLFAVLPHVPLEPSPSMDGSSSRNLSRVVAVCTCRQQPRSSCSTAAALPRHYRPQPPLSTDVLHRQKR